MNQNINFNINSSLNQEFSNYISYDKLLVKIPQLSVIRQELRYATQYLTSQKLYQSAKWFFLNFFINFFYRAGELLLGVTNESGIENSFLLKNFISNNTDNNYRFDKIYVEEYNTSSDTLMVARNLFDLREFKKCSHML